jgi:hypothetical protein
MKLRRGFVVVALLLVGGVAIWPAGLPVTAQDGDVPTATVIEGTCSSPGDAVGTLGELRARDGGEVLVSLTTVDVSLGDLLADDHAVVLNLADSVIACGAVGGSGNDVYVGVASTADAGWGGVAWLHARDARTQVSLFVARGLSGAGAAPTEEPSPPADDTPVPPEDETPTPSAGATRTPRATATRMTTGGRTYTSKSYGYSLVYDPGVWRKLQEISKPADSGPLDIFKLTNETSSVTLVGETGSAGFTAVALCNARVDQYSGDETVSGLAVRGETEGDESRASAVIDYTYTTEDGTPYDWTTWIGCYVAPDNSAMLSFFFSSPPESYDEQTAAREELIAGMTFPGE